MKTLVFFLFFSFSRIADGFSSEVVGLSDEQKKQRVDQMYRSHQKKFPTVETLSIPDFLKLQTTQKKMTVVDVRSPAEQKVSMIPGAISFQEFKKKRAQYRNHLIITYCTIGYRSREFAAALKADGFRVKDLEGSLLGWLHKQQALVSGKEKTRKVHVYGEKWNLAPKPYKPIW